MQFVGAGLVSALPTGPPPQFVQDDTPSLPLPSRPRSLDWLPHRQNGSPSHPFAIAWAWKRKWEQPTRIAKESRRKEAPDSSRFLQDLSKLPTMNIKIKEAPINSQDSGNSGQGFIFDPPRFESFLKLGKASQFRQAQL